MHKRIWFRVALLAIFIAGLAWRQTQTVAADAALQSNDADWQTWDTLAYAVKFKVDPRILAELRGDVAPVHLNDPRVVAALGDMPAHPLTKTRFLVYLQHQPDLAALQSQVFASQVDERAALANLLKSDAADAQRGVKSVLESRRARAQVAAYQPFYVVNVVAVEGDLATIIELAQRSDVERIVANYPLQTLQAGPPTPPAQDQVAAAALDPANWNIARVGADRVWSELGVRGEGAVVASFDTGVAWQHLALSQSYRGRQANGSVNHNYNWFAPDSELYADGNLGPSYATEPYDCSGHGSHTVGTMVGDTGEPGGQIGLAPGAKWIALPGICDGAMPGGLRDDIGALKAFQWLLCPTDLSGNLSTADCSKAPDVVNNSWGSANPANDLLRPAIQRLRAAGIAPVFAAGNPAAEAGSIGSPGNAPEAITVGATDFEDQVAYFSGRGPSFYVGEQKPELSAPGVDVLSVDAYGSFLYASGTSMAAPHVAGLVALIVSADLQDGRRDFSVDEIEHFMELSARDLGKPGPDDDFGYGRIRAYEAVRWALTAGDLRGVVRDKTSGQPIAGAVMQGVDGADNRFAAATNAQGVYSATVPAGTYQMVVDAWGYEQAAFGDQQVFLGNQSLIDFSLTPLALRTLQGFVLGPNGPVGDALISVAEHPSTTTRSQANGSYTLSLPDGAWTLVVTAAGHRTLRTSVAANSGDATQDLALSAAPTILLVTADAYNGWFFGWPLDNIYRGALDEQGYSYDQWAIQHIDFSGIQPQADGSPGYGIPTAAFLAGYDVVIWAHAGCSFYFSCPFTQVDEVLQSYLDGDGHLIYSGQDAGITDGSVFFDERLHADVLARTAAGEGDTVHGVDFLQGIQLTLTNASLYGYSNGSIYFSPDAVAAQPGEGAAYPILLYDNDAGAAALAVDACDQTGRAVYLAVGYENLGPRGANRDPNFAALLDRSLTWVQSTQPARKFVVTTTQQDLPATLGGAARYEVQIINAGSAAADLTLAVSGSQWQTTIVSGTNALGSQITLAPCGQANLAVLVTPNADATPGAEDHALLTVAFADGASPQAIALTTTAATPWQPEAIDPLARYRLGVAATDDHTLYAVGGWDTYYADFYPSATDAVTHYNVCTRQWAYAASLPGARANVSVAALFGKLFAFGGHDLSFDPYGYITLETFDTVFVYDPATDVWESKAPLPLPMAGMATAVANGKIYLFGGEDKDGLVLDRTWEYDPASDSWRERARLPDDGRRYAAAAAIDGLIYLVGGWPELRRMDVYDPVADVWSASPPLNDGRYSAALVAGPDNALYSIGGASQRMYLAGTERYDPKLGHWQNVAPLNDPLRLGVGAAYAGGRIVAVGGYLASIDESLLAGPSFCNSAKRMANAAIIPGTPNVFTIELRSDRVDLGNVGLIDHIPAQLQFVDFDQNTIGAVYNDELHQIEWHGALPANAGALQISYRTMLADSGWTSGERVEGRVEFSIGDELRFERTVKGLILTPDFGGSTFSADRARVRSGDVMTYTVSLRGETVAGGALAVHDVLPDGVEYIDDSLRYPLGQGVYDAATHTIDWAGVVPSGVLENGDPNYIWGDSDGGGAIADVAYKWVDIGNRGVPISGYDDAYTCGLPIGFTFPYFGEPQTNFCVSTNGFVSFDSLGSSDLSNDCPMPQPSGNNAVIAAVWDDLIVMQGMSYATLGKAPDRQLVVQWSGMRHFGIYTDNLAEFQLILAENGQIRFQVKKVGSLSGAESTTGLEDSTGLVGVTFACNQARTLHDGLAVLFAPNTRAVKSTDISFQVRHAADVGVNQVVTNTATISTPGEVIERSVTTFVNPIDLAKSTVTVSSDQVSPNQEVHYTVIVRNTGLVAAQPLLAMTVPSATTVVENSLTCSSGVCEVAGAEVRWRGDVKPGQPLNLTFAVRLTTPLPDNTAVTSQLTLNDGAGKIYQRTVTFLARRSDLSASLVEVRPPYIDPGGAATVFLFVRNRGAAPANALLTHTPSPGLTVETGTLACGIGVCTFENGNVQWQGAVPPLTTIQISYRIRAPESVAYGAQFIESVTVKDMDWGDEYTSATPLLVAHPTFLPLIHFSDPTLAPAEPLTDIAASTAVTLTLEAVAAESAAGGQ